MQNSKSRDDKLNDSSSNPILGFCLLCELGQGRAAISMGGKTGDRERNRDKVHFTVAHCQWGKKRVC